MFNMLESYDNVSCVKNNTTQIGNDLFTRAPPPEFELMNGGGAEREEEEEAKLICMRK